jgi:formate dehydrogenase accessory protein FdhD
MRIPGPALVESGAVRLDGGTRTPVRETLAEETPVALLFNGVPHVVMMATPADLEDFALGFALSEGIVAEAAELTLVDRVSREHGLALHLAIPGPRFEALQARRRNLVGRSGCGLCGAEALDDAIRPVPRVSPVASIEPARLSHAFAALEGAQPLNRECGALHAAAALIGEELLVREDVGRHNALDKVIGALARSGRRAEALLVTSRASYELVHKAACADVATLAAVSAPTAFAVRLAREAGMNLYAFARAGRMTRYAP